MFKILHVKNEINSDMIDMIDGIELCVPITFNISYSSGARFCVSRCLRNVILKSFLNARANYIGVGFNNYHFVV